MDQCGAVVNWAHIIETVKLSIMSCGWSFVVLISSWDQLTSHHDDVCVNACEELRNLLIERGKLKVCVCTSVCLCVTIVYNHPFCVHIKFCVQQCWANMAALSRSIFRDRLLFLATFETSFPSQLCQRRHLIKEKCFNVSTLKIIIYFLKSKVALLSSPLMAHIYHLPILFLTSLTFSHHL